MKYKKTKRKDRMTKTTITIRESTPSVIKHTTLKRESGKEKQTNKKNKQHSIERITIICQLDHTVIIFTASTTTAIQTTKVQLNYHTKKQQKAKVVLSFYLPRRLR